MQDYTGKMIDRYRVIGQYGVGGMAIVYHAYDTRLERDVAIKLIRTENIPASQHDRLMQRFEREAKSQAKFSHPNIISVHDYGEVDGTPYLVMEYVPGGTLKDKVGSACNLADIITWLAPIADALQYAHVRNVIHRDVKPSNILLTEDNRPMLTDFGIAKLLETNDMTLTGTGLGVGTPEYMAPEQWKGKVVPQTDIYALGVVFYELLTGVKPYHADTPAAVAILQATEPLPKLSQYVENVPETVENFLYKALAIHPEDRFHNMNAMKQAMEGVFLEKILFERPLIQIDISDSPSSDEETKDELAIEEENTPALKVEKFVENRKEKNKWVWVFGVLILVVWMIVIQQNNFGQSRRYNDTSSDKETIFLTITSTEVASPTIHPTKTFELGSTSIRQSDGMEMAFVPAGTFLMGRDSSDGTLPLREVFVDGFWIDKYEITNEQYHRCIEAGACDRPYSISSNSSPVYFEDDFFSQYPVINVDWYQAQSYCLWIGGSLPTEAQWEKAARGEDERLYPWGNTSATCSVVNHTGCNTDTVKVGSYPNNFSPYGVFDMIGNVWEWVFDWYAKDINEDNDLGESNPQGPIEGNSKVIKGGGWSSFGGIPVIPSRNSQYPKTYTKDTGFRCVMDAD